MKLLIDDDIEAYSWLGLAALLEIHLRFTYGAGKLVLVRMHAWQMGRVAW